MPWKRSLDLLSTKKRRNEESTWLATERTQEGDLASGRAPIQIVVGLDLGTSFTKVVVGESRNHYAVPFGEFSLSNNPYLLPSAVSVQKANGECTPGVNENGTHVFHDIKLPLIERDFGEQVQIRAIVFLALLFRYVRGWFYSTHGHTYRNREVQWVVNIGLPTDSFDDEVLKEMFLKITRTAWRSSVVRGPISFTACAADLRLVNKQTEHRAEYYSGRFPPDYRINAFPEFAAQLKGYSRSPLRWSDLFVMIDAGGGTVDVTVFNVLHRMAETRCTIIARTVRPLGTQFLIRHRFKRLRINDFRQMSPFEDLLSYREFARLRNTSMRRIAEIDMPFRRKIQRCIGDALCHSEQFHPESARWNSGLPTFFCGGATSSEIYTTSLGTSRLVPIDLPEPANLVADLRKGIPYNRLALAYGLSFGASKIIRLNRGDENGG